MWSLRLRDQNTGDGVAVGAERIRYELVFAVTGRPKFLSHLETQQVLIGALRRAGAEFALSEGMRPKPVIRLAIPRSVGMEANCEIAEVDLGRRVVPEELMNALNKTLPTGMSISGVTELPENYISASRRVVGSVLRLTIECGDDARTRSDLVDLVNELQDGGIDGRDHTQIDWIITRTNPKGKQRIVDVASHVDEIRVEAGDENENPGIQVELVCRTLMTSEGGVKPSEIIDVLSRRINQPLTLKRMIRESVTLSQNRVRYLKDESHPGSNSTVNSGRIPNNGIIGHSEKEARQDKAVV